MKRSKAAIVLAFIAVSAVCLSACLPSDLWATDFSKVEVMDAYADGHYHYYYDRLTDNAKIAYMMILAEIREHPEKIEIPMLTEDEYHALSRALNYDNPDLLCMGRSDAMETRGSFCYFVPTYALDKATCDEHIRQTELEVQRVLESVPAGADEFQKELYFHDYLVKNCVYDDSETEPRRDVYETFVGKKIVCEGYARGVQLLLNRSGISNYLIVNDDHMWNIVTLNGQNYHLDVTWDDLDSKDKNFVSHVYFNVTDREISIDHKNLQPAVNNCTSTEMSYFTREGGYFNAYTKSEKDKIADRIVHNVQNGKKEIEIRFADKASYDRAHRGLLKGQDVFEILDKVNRSLDKKLKTDNIDYYDYDDLYSMHLIFH